MPSPPLTIPVKAISLGIVIALAIYIGMVVVADGETFSQAVQRLPALLWVQIIALSLSSYLLRFIRWHMFLRALGHPLPLFSNLVIYLSAFALTLTPAKTGETVRSVYLHPHGVSYPHSLGAFFSERLLDLVAVGTLALLIIGLYPGQHRWLLLALAFIVTLVMFFRSPLLLMLSQRFSRRALGRYAQQGVATIRFLLAGRRLGLGLPLSVLAWGAQGFSLYLITQALGYELAAGTVIGIYCLSILAGAVSFIPGGLGATEAAIALLLTAAGVASGDAIAASLFSRALTLWLSIAIGALAMIQAALRYQPSPRTSD